MRLCGNNRNPEIFYFASLTTLNRVEQFYITFDACVENKNNNYMVLAGTHNSSNRTVTTVVDIAFTDVKPEGQTVRSVKKNFALDLAEEIRNGRLRNVAGKGCVVIDGPANNAGRSFDKLIADMKEGVFEDKGLTPLMVKNLIENNKPIYAVGVGTSRQLVAKTPKMSKKALYEFEETP